MLKLVKSKLEKLGHFQDDIACTEFALWSPIIAGLTSIRQELDKVSNHNLLTTTLLSTKAFTKDETGSGNILSMFWTMIILTVGGIAIDGANGWRVNNQLQAASDASAMAAASQLPDEAAATELALKLAKMNLNSDDVIRAEDIKYAYYDGATNSYDTSGDFPSNAVYVSAQRSADRKNPIANSVLRLVGQDYFETNSSSVAIAEEAVVGTVEGNIVVPTCASLTILTENFLNVGGGSTYTGGVCLHGATGVLTGGGDYFGPDVRISAENIDNIRINHTVEGSATAEELSVEGVQKPKILPNLEADFDELWTGLYESTATHYYGNLLPDNIYKGLESGSEGAKIVRVNKGHWTIQPGDLEPNTIYLAKGGVQMAGGVDAERIAIIAKGQIGVGGGKSLHFKDVFFFADGALNFSGDVLWGDPNTYCQSGKYNTYLFSNRRLSLGGSGPDGGAYGVVGAAPDFNPGGGMKSAGGLYFEASRYTTLGGNVNIDGCEAALQSYYEISQPEGVASEAIQTRKIGRLLR